MDVRSTILEVSAPNFDKLRIHHKISIHLHQLAVNFVRGNVSPKSQYELLRETKFPLPQHITLPHE
jgi:hypothetical protein